jgi:guanylate kinase
LDIDVQGAEKVYKRDIDSNFIFILPCEDLEKAQEVLISRLEGRGTETTIKLIFILLNFQPKIEYKEQIETRIENSKKEIEAYGKADFFTHTLINDDLDTATENLFTLLEKDYETELANTSS